MASKLVPFRYDKRNHRQALVESNSKAEEGDDAVEFDVSLRKIAVCKPESTNSAFS